MMRSMTGFVKRTFNIEEYGTVFLEIKSLNGKTLSPVFRMPDEMNEIEMKMRRIIKKYYSRSTVFINVKTDYSEVYLAHALAHKLKKIKSVIEILGNNEHSGLLVNSLLDKMPSVSSMEESQKDEFIDNLREALEHINSMRVKEGEQMEKEISQYCSRIEERLDIVEAMKDEIIEQKKQKLKRIIEQNEELIMDNILVYADKIDISEETSRMRYHIEKIRNAQSGSTVYFVLQEMHREVNTMGAKSDAIEIKEAVIAMKEIIEKMKEQVMNIE